MSAAIEPTPARESFVRRYLVSSDHKLVAKQYLWFGLSFLWIGGIAAMNMRWHLAYPGHVTPFIPVLYYRTGGRIGPFDYANAFTLHGTVMIFFAVTPIVVGWMGNFVVPLMIGARRMALPWLNVVAFWSTFAGGMVLLTGMYMPLGGPAAGWTSYPPLSSTVGAPGTGQSYWCAAMLFTSVGTLLGAVNLLTTIARRRAPGLSWFRLPLTVWGVFLTSVLNALFVPVLIAGTLLLWLDRSAGTHFFAAGMAATRGGGDPVLYQHLFWIFGHPEVYILILPIWGVVSDLLAVFARKPAYGYRSTVFAMIAVTALAALVYGHHMFTTGLDPMLSQAFMTLTLIISVPSAIFFLNWLGTLWLGAIRFTPPMLYALGVIAVFAIGGLTGMFLGTVSLDVYLHDTFFVVGHFHFVMAAAVLLGSFAAIHYWFPKCFGRMMNDRLGRWHFALTFVLMLEVFGGMLLLGWSGMLRRLANPMSYEYLRHLQDANREVSRGAFALFAVQFLFIGNFAWSLFRGPRAAANPWNATTLEWSVASPPPAHNFDAIPNVLHGPHEHSRPDGTERDWVMQHEPVPASEVT